MSATSGGAYAQQRVERALSEMDWHPSDNIKRLLLEVVRRVLDDPGHPDNGDLGVPSEGEVS